LIKSWYFTFFSRSIFIIININGSFFYKNVFASLGGETTGDYNFTKLFQYHIKFVYTLHSYHLQYNGLWVKTLRLEQITPIDYCICIHIYMTYKKCNLSSTMLQDLFYGIATLILTSTYSGHYIIFFHERKPFNLKNRLIVFRDYNNKKTSS
jgi:hypothetical protein